MFPRVQIVLNNEFCNSLINHDVSIVIRYVSSLRAFVMFTYVKMDFEHFNFSSE